MPERQSTLTPEDQYGPYYIDPSISSMYESFPPTNNNDNSQEVPRDPQLVELRPIPGEMNSSK